MTRSIRLSVRALGKSFVLHTQAGAHIKAFQGLDFDVHDGECVALAGPSGSGKSSVLRCVYGNYLIQQGRVRVRTSERFAAIDRADPRELLMLRRHVIGYVSQFLRALPRTSCLDVVCAPLVARGTDPVRARRRAAAMLERLHIDRTLWPLAPATFSGGEQQRINVARGLICDHPLLLLDEPTASLDADNASIVAELVEEACARGAAVLGIFHDSALRNRLAHRQVPLEPPHEPLG